MTFQDFIKPELLILIPVLYLIAEGIKKNNTIDNKNIPWILGIAAIFLCAAWLYANCEISDSKDILLFIFTSVTQGVLIAGASVYANQVYKQIGKDE